MRSFKNYMIESMIVEGTPMSKSLQSLFNIFTQSWRLSKDLRFLKDKNTRKEVCDLIKNVNYCNKTLYRYTYSDFGKIPTTKVGHTCYEPLLSTTENEPFVDSKLYKLAYNDHFADMKTQSPQKHVYCKIVFLPGTKSLDISDYSAFSEQEEWIVCGKFKVVDVKEEEIEGKTMSGDPIPFLKRTITVAQVFDEDIEDIFEKIYSLKNSKEYSEKNNVEPVKTEEDKKANDRDMIVDFLTHYSKKSIAANEVARIEKKGIKIDYDFLRDLLSRRVYNNVSKMCPGLTYDRMIEIAKENDIKITGNKKFGYPEIEFAEKI